MLVTPRRSPRIECDAGAYWIRWRTRFEGQVRRCNAHGMFISTPHDANVGFMMDLNIVLPARVISCTAIPRFVGDSPDGHGIGIELHVVDPSDRAYWHAFYRETLESQGRSWRGYAGYTGGYTLG
jgi:hypothetical protein